MPDISIPHIAWRNGRPRFAPGPALRKQGHKSHDLKNTDQSWMSEGQCIDWSNSFSARIEADRQQGRAKKAKIKKQVRAKIAATVPKPTIKKSYTLGQLLEDFLTNGMAGNAANTSRLYRSMVNDIEEDAPLAWLSEAEAITRPIAVGMYATFAKSRTSGVSKLMIRVLSVAYNWAIDNGRITTANPIYRIKVVDPEPRLRSATVEEYLHMLETATRLELSGVADMLAWGVWTAQRSGDRVMMRPADIRDNRLEITQQKTKASVSVPLSKALRDRMPKLGNDPFVIPDIEGTTVRNRVQNYRRLWRIVREEAAITMPSVADLRDQDLRDTSVSWMGRAGCTTQQIFSVTGHRQQGETRILRHYMAAHFDIADQAIAKLEKWFNAQVKKLKGKGVPCD